MHARKLLPPFTTLLSPFRSLITVTFSTPGDEAWSRGWRLSPPAPSSAELDRFLLKTHEFLGSFRKFNPAAERTSSCRFIGSNGHAQRRRNSFPFTPTLQPFQTVHRTAQVSLGSSIRAKCSVQSTPFWNCCEIQGVRFVVMFDRFYPLIEMVDKEPDPPRIDDT